PNSEFFHESVLRKLSPGVRLTFRRPHPPIQLPDSSPIPIYLLLGSAEVRLGTRFANTPTCPLCKSVWRKKARARTKMCARTKRRLQERARPCWCSPWRSVLAVFSSGSLLG